MDNNLLKQLILRHRRVVIPDFGAFLKKETPEGEALVFSPFLRKDDGVVTNAIVREYGVETEDARAMVSEFVIYLRQSLASSGKYYIEGIGMLAADANGTITLREGERPEREPVVEPERPAAMAQQPIAQPIPQQPIPTVQPIAQPIPQQPIVQQPVQPLPPVQQIPQMQPQQPVQVPPMMSRPQSIQMQGQVPQPQQVFARPQQPQAQQQRQIPMQQAQQQRQMPMQQPQPGQRQMPMQQPQTQRPMGQPGQRPTNVQQQGIAQQQPQRPMNGSASSARPGGMSGGQHPGGGNRPGGQGQRRPGPPVRRRQPKTKTDIWLVVAIIAALVVIAIMIYKFVVIDMQNDDIDMNFLNESMAPAPTETVDSELDIDE